MAIDIRTVREYLKAQSISERDACSDELVLSKEQAREFFDSLEQIEADLMPKVAMIDLAISMRDIILKAYGHQADDWKYHELAREREGVFKEMKDNPDPETR